MKKHIACLAICIAFLCIAWGEIIFAQLAQKTTKPLQKSPEAVQKPPVELFSCWTGQSIGYKDPKTGDLVLTGLHKVIPRSKIRQVSKEEFERLVQKHRLTQLKMYKNPTPKMIPAWHPPIWRETETAGVSYSSGGCVSLCWFMAEGGAMCQGCCTDVGGGACSCWEYCADYSSSDAPKK